MIRVDLAPEPPDFDRRVRQPGLHALAEMVGEVAPVRTGPKREKIAERRVAANFGLGTNSARRWISSGFADP